MVGKKKNREDEWQLSQIKLKEHAYEENVERNFWIINNEKNKLVVGLWKHLNIMRWQPATNGNNYLLEINEEMKTAFAERIGKNMDHW